MAAVLEVGDPLAHRALQALLRAETAVRRMITRELEREGVTAAGFSVLVVLTTAGGQLELKTLRRRLGWSKANATEVTTTLEVRGLVARVFPDHARRVSDAFEGLDPEEKRSLAAICRKLAA